MSADPAGLDAATIAVHDVDCPDAGYCTATPTSMGRYRALAKAAVRAAAPHIRRAALIEAADELERSPWLGYQSAAMRLRERAERETT